MEYRKKKDFAESSEISYPINQSTSYPLYHTPVMETGAEITLVGYHALRWCVKDIFLQW